MSNQLPNLFPNKLSAHFPMIRSREEVLCDIGSDSQLAMIFHSWSEAQQTEFLDFCTGQRSACYSADLLLRQYKRVRERKKQENRTFSYRDVKNVYTVVLFETSPQEFHAPEFKDTYLHSFYPTSDTGIVLELLQNYCFIPLDIFKNCPQTKGITNRLDAWLTFLSTDDPDSIVALITQYPDSKDLYTDIYELCRNTEDVMGLFSKELQMLDENTVQYMIDDMQDKIDEQAVTIDEQASTIDEQASTIDELQVSNQKLQSSNQELLQKLQKLEEELASKE